MRRIPCIFSHSGRQRAIHACLLVFGITSWGLLGEVLQAAPAPEPSAMPIATAEITQFAESYAPRDPARQKAIIQILTAIPPNPAILTRIAKPAESLPWWRYRPILVTSKRYERGLAFWRTHQAILERAERTFGVPPEVVVAILGVEGNYGEDMHRFSVLEALTTLGFYYPPRAAFFRSELLHFLHLADQEGWDIHAIRGSYAGAMGMAQFIPSSYAKLAIDFTGNGRRDLFNEPADAIGSVAHYLEKSGWKRGEPLFVPVSRTRPVPLSPGKIPKPHRTLAEWKKDGVHWPANPVLAIPGFTPIPVLRDPVSLELPAALITLEEKEHLTEWLILTNFYVVTRYNLSNLYAMAVSQLAAHLRQGWDATQPDGKRR